MIKRIEDPDYGVYFETDLRNAPFDFEQDPNEFLALYIQPHGVVTKPKEQELPRNYMVPDVGFIKAAKDQWQLCHDETLISISQMLDDWLKFNNKRY